MIKLGEKVKCIVSGFTGITTARIEYLNGCIQYCVKPKMEKDGRNRDGIYIDQEQLEVVGSGILAAKKKPKKKKRTGRPGGPAQDAPSDSYRGDGSNEEAGDDGGY